MRNNSEDTKNYGMRIENQLVLASMEWVPVDNEVIDPDSPTMLIMNPAGAIDILMPDFNPSGGTGAVMKGLAFLMVNKSASIITLKTSADAAFTTAITVGANASKWVFCMGDASAVLGWRGTP